MSAVSLSAQTKVGKPFDSSALMQWMPWSGFRGIGKYEHGNVLLCEDIETET